MFLCPFPDKKKVSQWYGENPAHYKKYGTNGHTGIDFAVPVGTPVYAPHEGFVTLKDSGDKAYGKHVIITSAPGKDGVCRRTILAHLSKFIAKAGAFIPMGEQVALSGNTGDSTGPHTHWDHCALDEHGNILNYNNGFHGSINLAPIVGGKRTPYFVLWSLFPV